jgi:single-strand DNA-binding protein
MQQNTLTLIGSIASEILQSTSDDGAPLAMFTLTTVNRRLDRRNNTWVTGAPVCMTVTCTRRLAHNVVAGLRRGDPVIVTGRLRLHQSGDSRLSRVQIEAVGVGPDLNRVRVSLERQAASSVA